MRGDLYRHKTYFLADVVPSKAGIAQEVHNQYNMIDDDGREAFKSLLLSGKLADFREKLGEFTLLGLKQKNRYIDQVPNLVGGAAIKQVAYTRGG
jgi:hypothetical protein